MHTILSSHHETLTAKLRAVVSRLYARDLRRGAEDAAARDFITLPSSVHEIGWVAGRLLWGRRQVRGRGKERERGRETCSSPAAFDVRVEIESPDLEAVR